MRFFQWCVLERETYSCLWNAKIKSSTFEERRNRGWRRFWSCCLNVSSSVPWTFQMWFFILKWVCVKTESHFSWRKKKEKEKEHLKKKGLSFVYSHMWVICNFILRKEESTYFNYSGHVTRERLKLCTYSILRRYCYNDIKPFSQFTLTLHRQKGVSSDIVS